MTTPILPEFILTLFKNEVQTIVHKEVKKLCDIYNINYEEAKEKLGYVEFDVTETPGFRLMKKHETFAPNEERCQARMLHDLEIKQCSRHKLAEGKLCKKHANMQKNNKLKFGLMDDPLPDELRPEVLNEKKKRTIY